MRLACHHVCMSQDVAVPPWAARARRLFRAATQAIFTVLVVGLALKLTLHLAGWDDRWLRIIGQVVQTSLLVIAAAAGVTWLVGAVVQGYRDKK